MGNTLSGLLQRRRVAVLMLGLDNSGKTSILYKVLKGKKAVAVPTFGFNMEILSFNDIELDIMDVGGNKKIIPLWKHYLNTASALIYVIDCCDKRMEENKILLTDVITRPERKGIPLLVILNKVDNLQYHIKPEDLKLQLDLQNICKVHNYKVHLVSAETGYGLNEAFTWLCAAVGSAHAWEKIQKVIQKKNKISTQRHQHNYMTDSDTLSDYEDIADESIMQGQDLPQSPTYYDIKNDIEPWLAETDQTHSNKGTPESKIYSFLEDRARNEHFFHSEEMHGSKSVADSKATNVNAKLSRNDRSVPKHYVDTLSCRPLSQTVLRGERSLRRHKELTERNNPQKRVMDNTSQILKPKINILDKEASVETTKERKNEEIQ